MQPLITKNVQPDENVDYDLNGGKREKPKNVKRYTVNKKLLAILIVSLAVIIAAVIIVGKIAEKNAAREEADRYLNAGNYYSAIESYLHANMIDEASQALEKFDYYSNPTEIAMGNGKILVYHKDSSIYVYNKNNTNLSFGIGPGLGYDFFDSLVATQIGSNPFRVKVG